MLLPNAKSIRNTCRPRLLPTRPPKAPDHCVTDRELLGIGCKTRLMAGFGKVGGCQGWRPLVYHLSFLSIPFFHNKNCAGKYGVRRVRTHHWCCWQPLKSWLRRWGRHPDRHPPDECVPVEEMGTDRLHVMDMKPEAIAPSQSKVEWSKGEGTEESSFGFS